MAVMGRASWDEWIAEYESGHQNPRNRACHALGIPMITASILALPAVPFFPGFWKVPAGLFGVGWVLQFVGHAFEGKPPEFLKDPRFLLVGVRWWLAKIIGRA